MQSHRTARTPAPMPRRIAARITFTAARAALALAGRLLGREDAKGVLMSDTARCLYRLDDMDGEVVA